MNLQSMVFKMNKKPKDVQKIPLTQFQFSGYKPIHFTVAYSSTGGAS